MSKEKKEAHDDDDTDIKLISYSKVKKAKHYNMQGWWSW